jgi:hypothetical protein
VDDPGWGSRLSADGKQLIRRLVQAPIGCALVRKMPNKLSGQSVNVAASKIVELFTPKAENTRPADGRHMDALATEDISVHDKSHFPSLSAHLGQGASGFGVGVRTVPAFALCRFGNLSPIY